MIPLALKTVSTAAFIEVAQISNNVVHIDINSIGLIHVVSSVTLHSSKVTSEGPEESFTV